jgi:hypothetical protein
MPIWLDESGELLTWLTILSIIVGAVAVVARWYIRWLRQLIRDEVACRTELIQPHSNGGKSLPDIAAKVDRILARLEMEK